MREAAGFGPTAPRRFAYVRAWRPRRKIFVVVSMLVLITVVPTAVRYERWRDRYQPLDASEISTTSTAAEVDANVPTFGRYWHYRRGATIVVGAILSNRGPRPRP